MSRFSGLVAHVGKSTDHGDPRTITHLETGPLPLPVLSVDDRLVGRIEGVERIGTEVRVYGDIDWPAGQYSVAAHLRDVELPQGVVGDVIGTLCAMTVYAIAFAGELADGPVWEDALIQVSDR